MPRLSQAYSDGDPRRKQTRNVRPLAAMAGHASSAPVVWSL